MSRVCDLLSVGVMSGNKISHSNRKTRRRFLPNLKILSFKSEILGVDLTLKVAASTIRTINKFGGIDGFLVNYRFSKMSDLAKVLRSKVNKKLVKLGRLDEFKAKKIVRNKVEVKARAKAKIKASS